jgi:hypothetical protein
MIHPISVIPFCQGHFTPCAVKNMELADTASRLQGRPCRRLCHFWCFPGHFAHLHSHVAHLQRSIVNAQCRVAHLHSHFVRAQSDSAH